jgi:hypothetical protein
MQPIEPAHLIGRLSALRKLAAARARDAHIKTRLPRGARKARQDYEKNSETGYFKLGIPSLVFQVSDFQLLIFQELVFRIPCIPRLGIFLGLRPIHIRAIL